MKPIFTIGLNGKIENELLNEIGERLQNKMSDYHVLVYCHSGEDVMFNLYNADNAEKIDTESLKEIIKWQ